MTVVPLPARGTLHRLACTGPDVASGCVCKPPKPHLLADWQVAELTRQAVTTGVDAYLSNIESLLTALEQRPMNADQLDRFARLLQRGEGVALARVRR